jgi:hypothetical protein
VQPTDKPLPAGLNNPTSAPPGVHRNAVNLHTDLPTRDTTEDATALVHNAETATTPAPLPPPSTFLVLCSCVTEWVVIA